MHSAPMNSEEKLPIPTYYCTECRCIQALPESPDPLCKSCTEEPLVDVSQEDPYNMVVELEESARDRIRYKWMVGFGVPLGLIGFVIGCPALAKFGQLAWAPGGLLTIGGVSLGRAIANKIWTRGGRAAGVDEAITRYKTGMK